MSGKKRCRESASSGNAVGRNGFAQTRGFAKKEWTQAGDTGREPRISKNGADPLFGKEKTVSETGAYVDNRRVERLSG
jgi:hypothetical protein